MIHPRKPDVTAALSDPQTVRDAMAEALRSVERLEASEPAAEPPHPRRGVHQAESDGDAFTSPEEDAA